MIAMATGVVAMGRAIAMRTDFTSGELRRLAKRAKNAAQARRLLAIATVLDGASRKDAARVGGMDHQTLRDWVVRFNAKGPEGLSNIPSPGVPPRLDPTHKAFLARIVDEGPIPTVHGAVHWRGRDLIVRLHEEFGLSVSDDTIYRALKELGFSYVSPSRMSKSRMSKSRVRKPWRRSKKLTLMRAGSPR
jgi:transposase